MAQLLILHGPNLNLLGVREPEIYGTDTLDAINQRLMQQVLRAGHQLEVLQSNAEHQLIDRIHAAKGDGIDLIVINPGALTHTSIALRDALLGIAIPFIEVHLSNIFSRESFRRRSYLSDIAVAVISGLGATVYRLAIDGAIDFLEKQAAKR